MMEQNKVRTQTHIISHAELADLLAETPPKNYDRVHGYSLVNVSPWEQFARIHIPGSINITEGSEEEFEYLFDKKKEIIVYGISPQNRLSLSIAEELTRRGFHNVMAYQGGLADWRSHGGQVHQFHVEGDY